MGVDEAVPKWHSVRPPALHPNLAEGEIVEVETSARGLNMRGALTSDFRQSNKLPVNILQDMVPD